MKLINPGSGEVSDRLTILTLKILTGTEQEKEIAHFEQERSALLTKIHARTLNAMWFDAYTELAGVNALLWHAEDDLRAWRARWEDRGPDSSGLSGGPGSGYKAATAEQIVLLAFRVQALNDRRADLVQQINKDAGDEAGKEK
jgi:hypothetical protein